MPTSAQHVQVGSVSKDGATQLSWLADLKWLFHFTCHPHILQWLQDPVSSAPSPLYFSDLISCYSPLPFHSSMVGSWVFLKPTRPAASFQPCIGFFLLYLHRSSWDPPHSVPHGLQGFAQMSPSQQANPGHLLKILICLYFTWAFLISNPFPCAICHHTTV